MYLRKFLTIYITALLFIFFIPNDSKVKAKESAEPIMNVKLRNYLGNQTQIMIKGNGEYLTADRQTVLKSGSLYYLKLESGKVNLYEGGKRIGQYDSFKVNPSLEGNLLYVNGRPYKGSFEFIIETIHNRPFIRPINQLYLEEYLKGVVPFEIFASWSREAVKAQAVAARTYALRRAGKMIDDTTSYQVYGGGKGHPNTDAAIKETEGQVLKYKNRLIDAVFSTSNGGKTESNTNAWGSDPTPYFVVKEDPYDLKDAWSFEIHKTQIDLTDKDLSQYEQWWNQVQEKGMNTAVIKNIKTWIANNGFKGKEIKIVSIPQLNFSNQASGGRVTKGSLVVHFLVNDPELVDSEGNLVQQKIEFHDVKASEVRKVLGSHIVKSYLIEEIEDTEDKIHVQGIGHGHGVGLSQWGAKNRAEASQNVYEILSFYYPGTQVVKEYTHHPLGMKDLPITHRFYSEIQYLLEQKVVTGFENGTFQPGRTVTRGQAAIMIGRARNLDGTKEIPFLMMYHRLLKRQVT